MIRHGVGGLFVIGVIATLLRVRPLTRKLGALAVLFGLFAAFYATVRPSNDRDWSPRSRNPPTGEVIGDTLTLHNVRNFQYRSDTGLHRALGDAHLRSVRDRGARTCSCRTGARR